MRRRSKNSFKNAFTLIEVLVATFILIVMVLILSKIFHQASVAWSAGFRRAEGNMTGRSAVGFMARELMNAVADEDILNDIDISDGEPWITFISLAGDCDAGVRVARKIRYQQNGKSLERMEWKALEGAYGTWGVVTKFVMVTNVVRVTFSTPESGGHYDYGVLPEWVRIKLTVNRSDDVSGVGAASAGPDGVFGNDDDLDSW